MGTQRERRRLKGKLVAKTDCLILVHAKKQYTHSEEVTTTTRIRSVSSETFLWSRRGLGLDGLALVSRLSLQEAVVTSTRRFTSCPKVAFVDQPTESLAGPGSSDIQSGHDPEVSAFIRDADRVATGFKRKRSLLKAMLNNHVFVQCTWSRQQITQFYRCRRTVFMSRAELWA